ncbi:peptidoglycan DD-metalloendopeptidase family protein [Oricola cellulosilytica]|uniref:LysM peptidoglycan-binding domain-containing protein n=1 Tax=Oricola cellulosilytica TaxID=1429082 RepID=A0A4R0P9D7_9HYPH|nr:peptidoglycan DD-metalloendopeptidase family protein [Oricola cellulosilytica]TCD12352.1 LysM peptidoglycan-binding domain-containing protein [Oricola cellulosilytica]
MRRNFTKSKLMQILKTATVLSVGGISAGCSSDVIRFSDGFYTGAVPKRAVVAASAATENYGTPNYQPGLDQSITGSIAPVQRAALPRPDGAAVAAPQPAAPLTAAQGAMPAPRAPTGATVASTGNASPRGSVSARQQTSAPSTGTGGWSSANATQVTLRQGETIYSLSKRYGVPSKAIMDANGIADARSVSAGQAVLIPTFARAGGDAKPSAPRVAEENTQVASLGSIPARPSAAAAPERARVSADGGRYTVVGGDTLSAISRRTGASVAAIKRVNGLSSDTVRIGQSLTIPGLSDSGAMNVAAAKNLDPIVTSKSAAAQSETKQVAAYTPPTSAKTSDGGGSIEKIETQETARAPDATGVKTMRWPVQGRIVSAFGSNEGGKPNDGIDISVPTGTAVKAAENGVVIYSGDGLKELGKTVLVRHSDGYVTVYGHVSELAVKRGDTVRRGQQIASSGMSGSAKKPQLHFEVRKNSAPVNPVKYLQ